MRNPLFVILLGLLSHGLGQGFPPAPEGSVSLIDNHGALVAAVPAEAPTGGSAAGSGRWQSVASFGPGPLEWALEYRVAPAHAPRKDAAKVQWGNALRVGFGDAFGTSVLDHGSPGALLHHRPPDCNPSLPAGEWQHLSVQASPDESGAARVTVLWNGVLVHDRVPLSDLDLTQQHPLSLTVGDPRITLRNVWARVGRPATPGKLELPPYFADHMVIQRDGGGAVFGQTDPNEKVIVGLGDQESRGSADDNGRFRIPCPSVTPGGPYVLTVSAAGNTKTFQDVLVGDVWLCSGQSNMRWPVRACRDGEEEIAAAQHPRLRLASVGDAVAPEPATTARVTWAVCTPETVKDFSATAYYFGRSLQSHVDVPIGLVMSAVGGTPVEAWTARATLGDRPVVSRWQDRVAQVQAEWDRSLSAWEAAAKAAAVAGTPAPDKPKKPGLPATHEPGVLFHGMIAPILDAGYRGVIWYQGESNTDRAAEYAELFPLMIRDWQSRLGPVPFLFVQLPNFHWNRNNPTDDAWAWLREAQTRALTIPHTAMACTLDIGEPTDIHPKNKQDVGHRLALLAARSVFGLDVIADGPRMTSVFLGSDKCVVAFRDATGLRKRGDGPIAGFAVAGEDRRWHPAEATIVGEEVHLRCPAVPNPVAVRYAWLSNPISALENGAGLPAAPFRTDDWPRD